jgi:hypothetical protein
VARLLELDELVEHWTLLDDERELIAGKRGPTRLDFAVLLKFYTRLGRFPRGRSELPDEDLVGAAGQPGHDLGDPSGVAWGRSLGCRPMWATAAVKLGGRPFGELRPALAWRDDLLVARLHP